MVAPIFVFFGLVTNYQNNKWLHEYLPHNCKHVYIVSRPITEVLINGAVALNLPPMYFLPI